MDKMGIFSDTINESFGYREIEWKDNTYMIDFNNDGSVLKFLKLVSAESSLNNAIEIIPDSVLKGTNYGKFHESINNGNWVLYSVDQYNVVHANNGKKYLNYTGIFPTPKQPINCSSMFAMFEGYSGGHLDLSSWDVSDVSNMSYMFATCTLLTTLDMADWDVRKVTDMSYMFSLSSSLETLDIASWDVSNARNTANMFHYCSSLISLNLTDWNISNITNFNSMFRNCHKLTSLDLASWSKSYDSRAENMFTGCKLLQTTNNKEFDKLLKECN